MTDRHRLAKAHEYISFVVAHWPDLLESRIPGTRRSWTQTRTRAESRRQATLEGLGLAGATKAPAPLHLDVLDTIVDVVQIAHALADRVAQLAGVERPDPPSSAYADPRPYLSYVQEHLETAAEVDWQVVDDALDLRSDCSVARARNRTATALRLILGGQVLDCICPWCGGTPMKLEEHDGSWLVVCRSRLACSPPESDCGTWINGHPAWPPEEWEWLGKRIDYAVAKMQVAVASG